MFSLKSFYFAKKQTKNEKSPGLDKKHNTQIRIMLGHPRKVSLELVSECNIIQNETRLDFHFFTKGCTTLNSIHLPHGNSRLETICFTSQFSSPSVLVHMINAIFRSHLYKYRQSSLLQQHPNIMQHQWIHNNDWITV